ncbi:MAG: tRNA lysidine(34) synthetase TilS [Vicinamibacterales bacterium]
MSHLLDRVRRYAGEHQLWSPASRVLAAVSGGSDSVALLFILRELAFKGETNVCGLAHIDHRVRGSESADDATFCRLLAERVGLPFVIGEEDVPAVAAREGLSIEVAGRQVRHRFLSEAARSLGADRIALAHTRDDQAETLLLRLVRGAGPSGLSSIAPCRGALVRPLLDSTRAELRSYLAGLGESWREDSTNEDRANPRNRVRHEVLPLLRAHFNPRVDAALARTADILRKDHALLDELAIEAAARTLSQTGGRVTVDLTALRGLPAALARRVALKALETANPGRSYGLEEADSVRSLAAGLAAPDVAGVRMERSGQSVVIQKRGDRGAAGVGFELALPVPGSVTDPWGVWEVAAEGPVAAPSSFGSASGEAQVAVDAQRLGDGLHVRSRRPGDRLQPLGMTGRKKLQDVLVDRKVPRDQRDHVPIVTNASGQIVWVAGHALDEGFRVTPRTTTVVMLTLRRKNARRPS